MPDIEVAGTPQERKTFSEVYRHFEMASEDLDQRRTDFDKKDVLFRSHIDENKWPYRSLVFDPRVFTTLIEKGSRLLANKPRGRMVPREGGDSLGAKINNELLSFQWDDNERADGTPMLAKWSLMDLNARKYGAAFALCNWQYETQVIGGKRQIFYDAPNFKPWNNRDVLHNPSYSTIKNWIQLRSYPTFQELADTNDAARSKPIYKNLDLLRDQLKEEAKKGGDQRASNYVIKNKAIKGLTDYLGQDEVFKVIEVITEYRPDRWITFAPKHGVVLRDIPNPYAHGQIPVVMLKYYPIDDDLYGLSEIEPVERLQKAINALVCQYLDAINMSLYAPLKINSTGGAVQMHTLEFGPGKKWLMQNPSTDVITHDQQLTGVTEFTSTYRFLVGALSEALGETSAAVSNLVPGAEGKTVTEVKDLAVRRSARDNFNQIFLSEALKKQMMFWHKMNQQFLFSNPAEQQKVIRIVGKDAIKYFQDQGLDGEGLSDEGIELLSNPDMAGIATPQDLMQPIYPVNMEGNMVPKMVMENDSQSASLIIEPEDLAGNYDFIPDIESMTLPDDQQLIAAKKTAIELALNPATAQLLMQEGYSQNLKELLEDFYEQLGMKDADKYFKKLEQNQMMGGGANVGIDPATGQPVQAGAGGAQAGGVGMVNGQNQGMVGGPLPLSNGQNQPSIS